MCKLSAKAERELDQVDNTDLKACQKSFAELNSECCWCSLAIENVCDVCCAVLTVS